MKLNDKVYDVLKWIALVALNAVGVCYRAVAAIWHLPYGEEVMGTCSAIALCLGTLLGISTAQYNKDVARMHEATYIQQVTENNELREQIYGDMAD